jgi:hypothetical protein
MRSASGILGDATETSHPLKGSLTSDAALDKVSTSSPAQIKRSERLELNGRSPRAWRQVLRGAKRRRPRDTLPLRYSDWASGTRPQWRPVDNTIFVATSARRCPESRDTRRHDSGGRRRRSIPPAPPRACGIHSRLNAQRRSSRGPQMPSGFHADGLIDNYTRCSSRPCILPCTSFDAILQAILFVGTA